MAERPGSVEEVRTLVDEMGIEFIFAQFVEMYGKPNAKLVPAAHLEDVFADGAGFAGFATGELGQGPHDPDIAAMPDPASFTPVPWQPNLARFACDVFVEGEPWPYCPRTILKREHGAGHASAATCSRSASRRSSSSPVAPRTAGSRWRTRSTPSNGPATT